MASSTYVVLPSNILENLKCMNCSLYLSVPPIMYNYEQSLVCGRCNYKGKLLIRAKAFETVAKLLIFPCRYVTNGCPKSELNWKMVEGHETLCNYRNHKCPSIGNCEWQGSSKMILEHFKKEHELLLLFGDFNLDLTVNAREIKLIQALDQDFLLEFRIDVEEGKVRFGIAQIALQHEENSTNFTYSLELKNPDDRNTIKFNYGVKSNCEWNFDSSEMLEISVSAIQNILNTPLVRCSINIIDTVKPKKKENKIVQAIEETERSASSSYETQQKINKDLLNELECPVCTKYMISPIFVCQNGHSICGNCKSKVSSCPNCTAPLENTRNFALEKLTNCINYPCRNESSGCKFVGNSCTISDHNKNCTFKVVGCPLKEFKLCNWRGPCENILHHVKGRHCNYAWMTVNQMLYRDLSHALLKDFNILTYEEQLFKICCKHSSRGKGPVSWAFQHVGLDPNDMPVYKFEIEFLDQTNSGRKLIINALCDSMVDDKDAFKNCLTISYDLLSPFINGNKLIFKYHVQRN